MNPLSVIRGIWWRQALRRRITHARCQPAAPQREGANRAPQLIATQPHMRARLAPINTARYPRGLRRIAAPQGVDTAWGSLHYARLLRGHGFDDLSCSPLMRRLRLTEGGHRETDTVGAGDHAERVPIGRGEDIGRTRDGGAYFAAEGKAAPRSQRPRRYYRDGANDATVVFFEEDIGSLGNVRMGRGRLAGCPAGWIRRLCGRLSRNASHPRARSSQAKRRA